MLLVKNISKQEYALSRPIYCCCQICMTFVNGMDQVCRLEVHRHHDDLNIETKALCCP